MTVDQLQATLLSNEFQINFLEQLFEVEASLPPALQNPHGPRAVAWFRAVVALLQHKNHSIRNCTELDTKTFVNVSNTVQLKAVPNNVIYVDFKLRKRVNP